MKTNALLWMLGFFGLIAFLVSACAAPAAPPTPIAIAPTNAPVATLVAPTNVPPTIPPTAVPATATNMAVPPTNTFTPTNSPTSTLTATHTATLAPTFTDTPTLTPTKTFSPTRRPATRVPATATPSHTVPADQAGFLIQNRSGVPITVRVAGLTGGNLQEFALAADGEAFMTSPSRALLWVVKFPGNDFVPGGLAIFQMGQLKVLKIYKQPGGSCFQPTCYEYIPPNS